MSLELKKEKLYRQKAKNVYLELLSYQTKRNREYEAIMELIMAQAKTTLATKSKLAKVAKKAKIEPKKEAVEISARNKKIGMYIGIGLVALLILANLVG